MSTRLERFIIPLLVCAAGCSSQCGSADKTSGAATAAREQPASHARLYVSNEDSGDVSVVDLTDAREIGRIPVGKRPRALHLSHDQKQLFVALSGSAKSPDVPADRTADAIAVIDLASGRVVRRLESGSDPEGIDLSPDGAQLFVVNRAPARVSVVDVGTGKVSGWFAVGGGPEGIAAHPHGPIAYIACTDEHRVDVMDVQTHDPILGTVTGKRPRAIAIAGDGAKVYVADEGGPSITVLEGQRHELLGTVKIAQPSARPRGLALAADGARLFVTTGTGNTVLEVDTRTLAVTRSFDAIGREPSGIAVSGDGKQLYTANTAGNDVSILDVAAGKQVAHVAVGAAPHAVVLVGAGR